MSLDEKINELLTQVSELRELLEKRPDASPKATLTVSELAERWSLCEESVRLLIRQKKIKPLRGFRPYIITMDEVRRYEVGAEEAAQRAQARAAKGGRP